MTEPQALIEDHKSGHEPSVSRRAVFEGTGAALVATLLLGEVSFCDGCCCSGRDAIPTAWRCVCDCCGNRSLQ